MKTWKRILHNTILISIFIIIGLFIPSSNAELKYLNKKGKALVIYCPKGVDKGMDKCKYAEINVPDCVPYDFMLLPLRIHPYSININMPYHAKLDNEGNLLKIYTFYINRSTLEVLALTIWDKKWKDSKDKAKHWIYLHDGSIKEVDYEEVKKHLERKEETFNVEKSEA
jgi:hypothetical protein